MRKSKEKRLRSLRRQLKKCGDQEYRKWSYTIEPIDNPNVGGPGEYSAGVSSFPIEIFTRKQRIEQAIKTLNGGKL